MSNKDVSIVFKASDRLSESIRGMQKNVSNLQADVEAYRKVQDKVFNEKAEIKLDITKAKQSLKELEKEIKNGSQEADIILFSIALLPPPLLK